MPVGQVSPTSQYQYRICSKFTQLIAHLLFVNSKASRRSFPIRQSTGKCSKKVCYIRPIVSIILSRGLLFLPSQGGVLQHLMRTSPGPMSYLTPITRSSPISVRYTSRLILSIMGASLSPHYMTISKVEL